MAEQLVVVLQCGSKLTSIVRVKKQTQAKSPTYVTTAAENVFFKWILMPFFPSLSREDAPYQSISSKEEAVAYFMYKPSLCLKETSPWMSSIRKRSLFFLMLLLASCHQRGACKMHTEMLRADWLSCCNSSNTCLCIEFKEACVGKWYFQHVGQNTEWKLEFFHQSWYKRFYEPSEPTLLLKHHKRSLIYIQMNELFILITKMNQACWKSKLGCSLLSGYI